MPTPRRTVRKSKKREVTAADFWTADDQTAEERAAAEERRAERQRVSEERRFVARWTGPKVHKHCVGCGQPVGMWPADGRVLCSTCCVTYAKQRASAKAAREQAERERVCAFCGGPDPHHDPCPGYDAMLARYRASVRPLRMGVPWSYAIDKAAAAGGEPPWDRRADYDGSDIMLDGCAPCPPDEPYVLHDLGGGGTLATFATLAGALTLVGALLDGDPEATSGVALGYDDGEGRARTIAADAALAALARRRIGAGT